MRTALTFVMFAFSMITMSGCGQPVCIAGVGINGQDDCAGGTSGTSSTGSSSNSFSLAAVPTSVVVLRTSQVTASGGTKGPYTYSIDPNSNPSPTSGLAGSIDSSSGLYTAPSSISPNSSLTITIRATDTSGAYNTTTITVTSG